MKLKIGTWTSLTLGTSFILLGQNTFGGPAISHSQAQDKALSEGLKIWRKPGAINGGAACATCHSPDGIEIAAYNFSDDNIRRRAHPHLPEADGEILVEYFHALRTEKKLTPLRDTNADRPLQPGGEVLPGNTAAERDLAFGKELEHQLPILFGPPIETIDQAKAAEAELLKIKPVQLKIGIPLNRLSEDIAHGNEHATIAQWLPEVPPQIPTAHLEEWYAAEDHYLAEPTTANLKALLDLHTELVNTNRMQAIGALSAFKFRALLVWQDRIRNHTESNDQSVSSDVLAYGESNPIWQVGEMARQFMDRTPQQMGMDADTTTKKVTQVSLAEELHNLRVSWFWAGWLSDQGLFKTSHDDKTRLGMWISQSLSQDGPYPIHNVFANARRQAVISNDPLAWGEPNNRRRRIWDFAGLRSFNYQNRDLPTEPKYRELTIRFTANCFRMNLLLLKDNVLTNHYVWVKASTLTNIQTLTSFITAQQPEFAKRANELAAELKDLVDHSREIDQFSHP